MLKPDAPFRFHLEMRENSGMSVRNRRWIEGVLLFFILLIAAGLRWTGLDWDAYMHHHPDERYILWVATTIEMPSDWGSAFDPQESTFNPYYWPSMEGDNSIVVPEGEPRKFAYGHFPLYLGVMATRLAERAGEGLRPFFPSSWLFTRDILNGEGRIEYHHMASVTRALTGLFDLGTLLFVYLLGRRLFDGKTAVLAAAFLAFNVMHIQLAHFFAVDPYLTFFVVGAVYFMVRDRDNMKKRSILLAALFTGLAIGAKFSAVMLFLPLFAMIWRGGRKRRGILVLTAVILTILTFIITNPFALLDQTCALTSPVTRIGGITIPEIEWHSCYLDNVVRQSGMVRGGGNFPFTRQYEGTAAYVYPIEMQVRWGMGWPLGIAAFAGFGTFIAGALMKAAKKRRSSKSFTIDLSSLIVLAWVVPFFLVTGNFYVKFMRYMQPLTPFLMIFAAALLWQTAVTLKKFTPVLIGGVLLPTVVYAFAFVNMYQQPHPWRDASVWIYENVPSGTLILSEKWDDALPKSMTVNGRLHSRTDYQQAELTWLSGIDGADDAEKLEQNIALLAEAEYVTLATNRIYGVVPRLDEAYPLSHTYHQLLMDGKLGYEAAAVYCRFPTIFNLVIQPDTFDWATVRPSPAVATYLQEGGVSGGKMVWNNGRADESFLVYDQPLTIIFKNTGGMTAVEMAAAFEQ